MHKSQSMYKAPPEFHNRSNQQRSFLIADTRGKISQINHNSPVRYLHNQISQILAFSSKYPHGEDRWRRNRDKSEISYGMIIETSKK